jgi:hypothetical protein
MDDLLELLRLQRIRCLTADEAQIASAHEHDTHQIREKVLLKEQGMYVLATYTFF